MSSKKEKRMLESYEIIHSIWIGDKEVVFGQDERKALPYLCAFYTSNELFGTYQDCEVGDDYVEMMELFSERIKEQCIKVREEQEKVTVPREKITADMCREDHRSMDIVGKVMVVKADALRPEYRSAEHQLVFVTGGNGARGNSIGSTCVCENLYTGKRCSWKRYDIQGELRKDRMPKWAEKKLEEIQKGRKEKPAPVKEQGQEAR